MAARRFDIGTDTQALDVDTTDINTEISRRLDALTSRLDQLEARLPAVPRAISLTRATVHRINSTAGNVANGVGRRLGRFTSTAETALVDDAARAVEPHGDAKPASMDDWTKADLYQRAQELDIEGRSSMSRRALVRALRSVEAAPANSPISAIDRDPMDGRKRL